MSESKAEQLSNLKLSNNIIAISKEAKSAELTLINTHQSLVIYFKIKTKIEKVFEVKPVLGMIKPGEKQVVTFKATRKIEDSELSNLQQNLQFLIMAVNHLRDDLSKEEQDQLWKQIKTKHMHMDHGYCSVKLNVTFSDNLQMEKEFLPAFNVFESKVDNKFKSQVRSSKAPKPLSSFADSAAKSSFAQTQSLSDEQLCKKYESLKAKEQQLIRQRQKMFGGSAQESTPKKKSSKLKRSYAVRQF